MGRYLLKTGEAISEKEMEAKGIKLAVSVSEGNIKLGRVLNINQDPALSCRKDAPCRGVCYACKGNYRFRNVKTALQGNFWAYMHDPQGYFDAVSKVVKAKCTTPDHIVRWHSAGDIVDDAYFQGVIRVAEENPTVEFYIYTKQYEIVNRALDSGTAIPPNLCVLFSHAQKGWESHIQNPHRLPETYIDFVDEAMNPDAVHDPKATHCPAVARGKNPATGKERGKNLGYETGVTCTECRRCAHAKAGDVIVFYEH